MNRQDIIDMIAKVYGVAWTSEAQLKDLERFAALVASAEREAINKEAKAHLEELQKNFNAESAELRLHMWSQEKQA